MAIYSSNTSIPETNNSEKLQTLNILSVDFDWIMEPSIEIYNNIVNGAEFPWNNIYDNCPGLMLNADLNKYKQLCIILGNILHKIPDTSHFIYGMSHDGILDAFEQWKIGQQSYKLFNIDHHHDCGYSNQKDIKFEEISEPPTCANWVLGLTKKYPNCLEYFWIKNKQSADMIYDVCRDNLPPIYQTNDLDATYYTKFDYVFLCKSEPWVPPQYYALYDGLTNLLENIVNK